MKRAAILVLAIATLVLVVSPSTSLFAKSTYTPAKGNGGPDIVSPAVDKTRGAGPSVSSGQGGNGEGEDEGDADGLSGVKIKPATFNFGLGSGRVATTLMMWWRYILFFR
jgi:hypothetical protein